MLLAGEALQNRAGDNAVCSGRVSPTAYQKSYKQCAFLPGEAWKKGTTIPYNFSPTKERMERGGKEMIARWWQTCTGPGNMAPVAFNIEDIVKLKDINEILKNKGGLRG